MLVVRMSPSSLLQPKISEQNAVSPPAQSKTKGAKLEYTQPRGKKSCAHHHGRKLPAANLLEPFSSASSSPKTALERAGEKKKHPHTKPKPKSRYIHLGCSSSAGDLLPVSGRNRGEEGPGRPLLARGYSPSSCIVQNGEAPSCRQRSPPAGTPHQPQVSGRCWDGLPRPP